MKYLKKFNESDDFDFDGYNKYLDYDNLLIMVDNYLAYLKDDGYEIEFNDYDSDVYFKLKKNNEESYDFSDVENSISPFLILLSEKYNTLSIYIETSNSTTTGVYEIDNLLNGIESPIDIESIYIYIYPQKKPS